MSGPEHRPFLEKVVGFQELADEPHHAAARRHKAAHEVREGGREAGRTQREDWRQEGRGGRPAANGARMQDLRLYRPRRPRAILEVQEACMSKAPTGIRSRGLPLDHDVVEEIKRLAHAGWVDHVVIRDRHGQTLIHVPLTVGLAAFVLAPVWAVLGAMASMQAGCTIDIELRDEPAPAEEWPPEPGPKVDEDSPTTRG